LLELASRIYGEATAQFEGMTFTLHIVAPSTVEPKVFLGVIAEASLGALDPSDDTASPILVGDPFQLRLDWWHEERDLKVWAGSMRCLRIAAAMQAAIGTDACEASAILNHGAVVYDRVETNKKVEPFYFDGRRGAAAQAVDVGFSADALQMTTVAYPAVEFLCLVGLQRCRPRPTNRRRVFEYSTWREALDIQVAAAAVNGILPFVGAETFRFENAFRTDQRKHKAFTPATQTRRSE
jgi:CRISPR-associated protein Csb3